MLFPIYRSEKFISLYGEIEYSKRGEFEAQLLDYCTNNVCKNLASCQFNIHLFVYPLFTVMFFSFKNVF